MCSDTNEGDSATHGNDAGQCLKREDQPQPLPIRMFSPEY